MPSPESSLTLLKDKAAQEFYAQPFVKQLNPLMVSYIGGVHLLSVYALASLCLPAYFPAIGGVAPVLIDSIIDANTRRAVVLESTTEDLDHFERWSTSQADDAFLSEKFYFFNVTNPAAVMAGDEAGLHDVGPYAVRKDKTRQLKRAPQRLSAPLSRASD